MMCLSFASGGQADPVQILPCKVVHQKVLPFSQAYKPNITPSRAIS